MDKTVFEQGFEKKANLTSTVSTKFKGVANIIAKEGDKALENTGKAMSGATNAGKNMSKEVDLGHYYPKVAPSRKFWS